MSGGSFNYAYSRVNEFADDLEHKLDIAGEPILDYQFNDYVETHAQWDDATNVMLRQVVKDARRFAEVMRAVEWLYSSDSGPECVKQAMEAKP